MEGRVILVPGSTRSIGSAIVRRFLQSGCKVAYCGRTATGTEFQDVAEEDKVKGTAVDVRNKEELIAWVADTVKTFGGLDVLVNTVSYRLAPDGIRVNVVSPGHIYFPGGTWAGLETNAKPVFDAAMADIPMKRMGSKEEVANAVFFLASPESSYITGVNIRIDGGLSMGLNL